MNTATENGLEPPQVRREEAGRGSRESARQRRTSTRERAAAAGSPDTTQSPAGVPLQMRHLMLRRHRRAEYLDVSESCLFGFHRHRAKREALGVQRQSVEQRCTTVRRVTNGTHGPCSTNRMREIKIDGLVLSIMRKMWASSVFFKTIGLLLSL